MIRSSIADAARRAYLGFTRAVLLKADDTKKWQEVSVQGLAGEKWQGVEVVHPYGFTSVPLPPKGGQEAEVLIAFVNGSRSHPIAFPVGDRRYRPTAWEAGEVGLHDDQGQEIRLGRAGMVMTVPSGKSFTINAGGVSFKISSDGVAITGGSITHNGKAIDDTHKHGGIERGGALTDPPV